MKDADVIVSVRQLNKTYKNGFSALKGVDLDIKRGELLALLGPNGAGKTTMIGIITGLVNASSGSVTVDGYDIGRDFRQIRPKIGLVPQELLTDSFETVWATVSFSRGLFGKPANPELIEKILRDLSLWDKRNNKILSLSGGMKRRVLIAKALAHEPVLLFLDEPTAGVDVELRHDMWRMVRKLQENGVTIVLTTHYIEEAEDMADRIAVINQGEIMLIEEKEKLMHQLGKKELHIQLDKALMFIPPELASYQLSLVNEGKTLIYTYDTQQEHGQQLGIASFMKRLDQLKIEFSDLKSKESSLEEIFVNLVREAK